MTRRTVARDCTCAPSQLQPRIPRVTTAAIIGAGDLGGAVAHALATRESVDRVLIVDAAESAAAGKALDIQQAGAIEGFHTRLAGTGDLTRVAGCSVCVVADRFGSPSAEWHGDRGSRSSMCVCSRPRETRQSMFAGATQADCSRAAVDARRASAKRLIGSCPEALASAVRAIVAMEAVARRSRSSCRCSEHRPTGSS